MVLFFAAFHSPISAGQPNDSPLPPYPLQILAEYQGKQLPIISAKGKTAQLEFESKIKSVPGGTIFSFERARQFAPGSVVISNLIAESESMQPTDMRGITNRGALVDLGVNFYADLVSDRTYKNCYCALVMFDEAFLYDQTKQPTTRLFFKRIGTLASGEKKTVNFDLDGPEVRVGRTRLGSMLLIFCDGSQIHSSFDEISGAYFGSLEAFEHKKALTRYLQENQGKDQPAQKYRPTVQSIVVSPNLQARPAAVDVIFTVDTDGRATNVRLAESLPVLAGVDPASAFRTWLFLPRLVNGVPTISETKVSVALEKGEAGTK